MEVLKRRAVEEHSLADELKVKHCKGKGKKGKERTHTVSLPKAHTEVEVKQEPSDDNDTEEMLPGNQHTLMYLVGA